MAKRTFRNCIILLDVGAAAASAAADPRAKNLSLLDAAKGGGWEGVSSELLNDASVDTRHRFRNTALMHAARGAPIKTARILIEAGADAKQINGNRHTPFFEAAGTGKTGGVYAAANGDAQILRQLLDANNGPAISVDAQDSHALTLLMRATA
ncbi:MAG: ankyrin repeat domain-containing protein [Gammaproteobacteria bacterium]|nr:ankyrin repeat domain-containing protein [Gammaproteobacteria bacterium]